MMGQGLWLTLLSVVLLADGDVKTIDPPKGLHWGDSIDAIANAVKAEPDGLKLKAPNQDELRKGYREYREYGELALPAGFWRAEITGTKLFEKKAENAFVILDSAKELRSFQYVFVWDNNEKGSPLSSANKGFRKCWTFHSDLKVALARKYGEPVLDEATPNERARDIPSGVKYSVNWTDSSGAAIDLVITRQRHNMVIGVLDKYMVFLIYRSPGYEPPKEAEAPTSDDL